MLENSFDIKAKLFYKFVCLCFQAVNICKNRTISWFNFKARYLGNEDPNVADMDDKISAYGNLFTLQNRQGYQLGRMARILYAGIEIGDKINL